MVGDVAENFVHGVDDFLEDPVDSEVFEAFHDLWSVLNDDVVVGDVVDWFEDFFESYDSFTGEALGDLSDVVFVVDVVEHVSEGSEFFFGGFLGDEVLPVDVPGVGLVGGEQVLGGVGEEEEVRHVEGFVVEAAENSVKNFFIS